MKQCLVEVTCSLEQPQHTLHTLRLVLSTFDHHYPRHFMAHCDSLFVTHPIKQVTTTIDTSYTINTTTKRKMKIRSVVTKIECKIYFQNFLCDNECNFDNKYSFYMKNQMYLLVYCFIIFSNYDGCLIIITLVTYGGDVTNTQGEQGAALIVCIIKNNLYFDVKSCIVYDFGKQWSQHLDVIVILSVQFMFIYKILLVYHYLQEYQLYQNMLLLLYNNKYNRYKKCIIYIMVLKFLSKNIKSDLFYGCKTVVTSNTIILWYRKYVHILWYF